MWLELHDSVRDHPKIIKAARDLSIKRVYLLGHLVSLWTWALRMAPDGNLSSFDAEDIEIGAEWEGEPGKLIEVLENRGLLDCEGDHWIVHDWPEYARHLRAAEWKRQELLRKQRQATSGDNRGMSGAVHSTSGDSAQQCILSPRPTDRQTDRPYIPPTPLQGEDARGSPSASQDSATHAQPEVPEKPDPDEPHTTEEQNFEQARQLYPGKKRGFRVEFENFRKKHKDWRELLDDSGLAECVQTLIDRKAYSPGFWPHFQTFTNQSRYEEALQAPEVKR